MILFDNGKRSCLTTVNDRLDHIKMIFSNDLDILEYEEDKLAPQNLDENGEDEI